MNLTNATSLQVTTKTVGALDDGLNIDSYWSFMSTFLTVKR